MSVKSVFAQDKYWLNGALVRELRSTKRLKQETLEKKVGMGHGAISRIERQKESVSMNTASALAKERKIEVWNLIDRFDVSLDANWIPALPTRQRNALIGAIHHDNNGNSSLAVDDCTTLLNHLRPTEDSLVYREQCDLTSVRLGASLPADEDIWCSKVMPRCRCRSSSCAGSP